MRKRLLIWLLAGMLSCGTAAVIPAAAAYAAEAVEGIENPEENWVIFRNKHEPIIDRTTFERVQTMISKTRRRVPKKETEEKSIFTGLMRCGDCGHNMHFHVNSKNPDIHFFACSNSKVDKRGTCTPKRHYVRADAIEQIVKMELQRLITFLNADVLGQVMAAVTGGGVPTGTLSPAAIPSEAKAAADTGALLFSLLRWKEILLGAVLLILTRAVKPLKKLHPIVFIVFAALTGVVFRF